MVARRVAVVGGGLAGLSAATELKRSNCDITLFERSRLLGGKATSFEVDGIEVDNGQHVFLACCTEFVDFVEGLDIKAPGSLPPLTLQKRFDALMLARGKSPARLRAARLPAPLHLAPALLRYKHVPLYARLKIARAVLAARQPPKVGETFASWLKNHGQKEAARKAFWDPFLVPALNAALEDVSAEDALFVIRTAFLKDSGAARFGYSLVPLARIAESAARRIDTVYLRTPVTDLVLEEQAGGEGTFRGVRIEDGSVLPFDGVVLAVTPQRLQRILKDSRAFGVSGLDEFRTAAIVDAHLWYDVATIGFEFAALLDSPIQWVFEKSAGYVCCSMSAADERASVPNAELVELCDRELRELIPALAHATLLRGSATRDREATFVPTPGLRRPGPVTNDPRVVIAGAWTDTGWPATMESAVRSGRAAARALTVQMSASASEVQSTPAA